MGKISIDSKFIETLAFLNTNNRSRSGALISRDMMEITDYLVKLGFVNERYFDGEGTEGLGWREYSLTKEGRVYWDKILEHAKKCL